VRGCMLSEWVNILGGCLFRLTTRLTIMREDYGQRKVTAQFSTITVTSRVFGHHKKWKDTFFKAKVVIILKKGPIQKLKAPQRKDAFAPIVW